MYYISVHNSLTDFRQCSCVPAIVSGSVIPKVLSVIWAADNFSSSVIRRRLRSSTSSGISSIEIWVGCLPDHTVTHKNDDVHYFDYIQYSCKPNIQGSPFVTATSRSSFNMLKTFWRVFGVLKNVAGKSVFSLAFLMAPLCTSQWICWMSKIAQSKQLRVCFCVTATAPSSLPSCELISGTYNDNVTNSKECVNVNTSEQLC